MIMDLLVFLLTAYGITNIVVFSHLFTPIRDFLNKINPKFLGEMFSCPLCFSTWVGFLLSFIFNMVTNNPELSPITLSPEYLYLNIFLDGCMTSGGVWLIHTVQEYLED